MAVRGINFDPIRNALLGLPNQANQAGAPSKNDIVKMAQWGKIGSVAGALLGSVALLSSVVFSVAHPIIGALGITFALTLLVASYDAYKVSSNIDGLFQPGSNLNGWVARMAGALSVDLFVSKVFESTILAGALLRGPAASFLKASS